MIMQVLSGPSGQNNPAGGVILLLSDGVENQFPFIDDVKNDMVEAGVIVDTIAFTQAAEEKMYELADLTGLCFIPSLYEIHCGKVVECSLMIQKVPGSKSSQGHNVMLSWYLVI